MKKATVYLIFLGIICTATGVAAGVVIEKNYTRRNFPQIAREHFLRCQQQGPLSQGMMHQGGYAQQGHHRQEMGPHREGKRGMLQKRQAGQGCEKLLGRLDEQLDLNDEQKEKLQVVLEESKQRITQSRDEFQTQLKELKEESQTQILGLLSPEQKEKYQELTAKKQEKRQMRQH